MANRDFQIGAELALRGAGIKDERQKQELMAKITNLNIAETTRKLQQEMEFQKALPNIMQQATSPSIEGAYGYGPMQGGQMDMNKLAMGLMPYMQPAQGANMLMNMAGKEDPNADLSRKMFLEKYKASLGGWKPSSKEEALAFKEAGITEPKPYYQTVATSEGYKLVDTRSGLSQPLLNKEGKPVMPIAADVGLAGDKKAATEEAERKANLKKTMPQTREKLKSIERQWDIVDKTIDKALSQIGPFTSGFGAYLSKLPASQAKNLQENLNTIKANIGFDKLQDMRDNAKTGGALGQVSDLENKLLQATQGSLDQFQSDVQLKENLLSIKSNLQALKAQKQFAFQLDYRDFIGQEATPSNTPNGGTQKKIGKYTIEVVD